MPKSIFLILAGLLVGSLTLQAQKIQKGKALIGTPELVRAFKAEKASTFKVNGNKIMSPKGYLWVTNGEKVMLVSEKLDASLKGKDLYTPYFLQVKITQNIVLICSCDGSLFDSEGDNCDFKILESDITCAGDCTGENAEEKCKPANPNLAGISFVPQVQSQ